MTGRGRRPGSPDTRADILAAARRSFAESGFSGTSVRAIATAAGVDPSLVHHYFGTKNDLFVAALSLPIDPRVALAPVAAAGADGAGERLLRTFLAIWDDPDLQLPLLGFARTLLDPSGQQLVKDGFLAVVLGPVGVALGLDEPERRMALVASQVIGLIVLRYLVALEPLASMGPEEVVNLFAPTLQRYLTGALH